MKIHCPETETGSRYNVDSRPLISASQQKQMLPSNHPIRKRKECVRSILSMHPETCARTTHIWHLDRAICTFINIIQCGMAVESVTQSLSEGPGFATVTDQITISRSPRGRRTRTVTSLRGKSCPFCSENTPCLLCYVQNFILGVTY